MTPDAGPRRDRQDDLPARLAQMLDGRAEVAASHRPVDDGVRWPAEVDAVDLAVPARRADFRTGRTLARVALDRLGVPAQAVPVGAAREPRWPAGVVGSITHCPGLCVVAVARADRCRAIGIDAEPAEPLPPEVRELVGTPDELAAVAALGHPDRLLFCLKEAVFKAWSPHTGRWLDFLDVELTIRPDGTFEVAPVADHAEPEWAWLTGLRGTWWASEGWLLGAAVHHATVRD